MTKINKIPYILLLACTLFAFGCKSNSDSSNDDEPPVTVQPGDNVVFSNQTEFAVKIYSDSMQSILLMDVAAKESVSCHIDGVPTGNVFYFSYFMDVNGVSVPYGTDDYTVLLNDDSAMTVKITDPKVVNTNKRIILLKNEAASAIVLYSGNIEKFPEDKTASLVNGGDYGIYMLGARDDIATFTVVDGANRVPLSTAADFENGYIYTVVYDGAKIYMRSKGFLDRNMSKKIWKIGISHEAGKTLVNEKLLVRGNQNGYVLYGRIGYDVNLSYEEAVPYYAYIDSTGEITKENSFEFIDKPKCAAFIDAVEANGIRLALVEKASPTGIYSYSVMSDDNGYSINENIAQDNDTVVYLGKCILHKKGNVFCVLLRSYSENSDETYSFYRYELIEVTVEGYSSISTKKLCESDDSAFLFSDSFAYDSVTDTYIVMSQPGDKHGNGLGLTQFSFIDGTTGNIKKDLKLEKYLFNKVKVNPSDGYAYASGSFINQITGKDVASFAKIDISTESVVNEKPVQYPCQTSSLNSNFDDFVIDGDTIFLGGYTNADYNMGENTSTSPSITTSPYIVSYNAKEGKTIYEREYENLKGFRIYGINFSEIGSLLLNIFSDLTDEGYIVSTGLLGELPEKTKLTLPQSTAIKPMTAPDVAIEFYNDYVTNGAYNETSFKYGTTITLSDLEQYADVPNGYSVVGWYDWSNLNEEDVEVSFPFVITEIMKLYPKLKISPPTGIYGYALSDSEIYVQWDAHPFAQGYYLYWRDSYGNGDSTPVSNTTQYTISGLSPSTSYRISVIAYDSDNEEWSDHSAEYTVQTSEAVVENNWSSVPSGAEIMEPDTGNKYVYLSRNAVHYYYAYFEAGKTYCVWWADRDNADKIPDLVGYDPIADVVVYTYYAGGSKGEKHDTSCLISFNCTKSGYYVMEVQGISASEEGNYIITCYENSSML